VSINLNFYPFAIVSNNFHSYLTMAATEVFVTYKKKIEFIKRLVELRIMETFPRGVIVQGKLFSFLFYLLC
jgi:hypothetical protein